MEDDTRTCKACDKPRKLAEFRLLRSGNRAGTCIYCRNDARNSQRRERTKLHGVSDAARWARVNKDKMTGYRQKARSRNLEHVLAIKADTPCADCGQQFPAVCMDFDHLEDDKEASISEMMNQGWGLVKLDAEIAKCELVCSNCHRIRTATRGGWYAGSNYVSPDMVRVSS